MIKPHLKFLLAIPAGWLTKIFEVSALAFCLMIAMYDPVSGNDINVTAHIEADSLTVGDKFLYVNTIETHSSFDIEPAAVEDQWGDAFILSDIYKLPVSGPETESFACTLAVYKPGEAEIPSFVFNVTDSLGNTEKVSGEKNTVLVKSILPEDTTGIEIADIKEPMKLRGPIWPYLLIPLGIIILVLLIVIFRKYYRSKFEMPEIPPRPPWEIAYEKLDRLKAGKHTEFGRLKSFYFELSLIIREYLEERYQFPAAEYTTYELENTEKLGEIDESLYDRLFALFNRADLAKFAKFQPTADDAESDMKFAYDFVSKTIPIIEDAEEPNEKLEVAAK